MDITFGLMEGNMKACGRITKCMEEAFLHGLMVGYTRVNTI